MGLLTINLSGLESLMKDFNIKLYTLPSYVKRDLLDIASKSVLKEVKKKARRVRGEYSLPESNRATIANAAYIDSSHMNDFDPYAEINFKGTTNKYYEPRKSHPRKSRNGTWFTSHKHGITTNGRRRVAEIAFLNEYGVPRNKAQYVRGYLAQAMYDGMQNCVGELADYLSAYIAKSLVV